MNKKDYANKKNARTLRNNMTQWENKLWYQFLKDYPIKFRRQKRIGGFIVDFYCKEAKMVIELDGSQHYDDDKNIVKDRERDEVLSNMGMKVIRIQDGDITTNFDAVCVYINEILKKSIPDPQKIIDVFGE